MRNIAFFYYSLGLRRDRDNLLAIETLIVASEELKVMNAVYSTKTQANPFQEEMGDYVAQLQLHMTLQAKNLVPSLDGMRDSRQQLIHESQSHLEKMTSRLVA